MTVRPFRFGVNETPGPGTVGRARRLEELAFDAVLAPDRPQLPAPLPVLAGAAAATARIRIGTYVLAASLHEPQSLLRELKAVRAVAGDRFEPGFGAGLEAGSAEEKRSRLQSLLERVRVELPEARILVAASGRAGLAWRRATRGPWRSASRPRPATRRFCGASRCSTARKVRSS